MLEWIDPSSICRNEFCVIEELHAPHQVRSRKEPRPRSHRPPWVLPAPIALDESILRAVSDVVPRHFMAIVDLVQNDFGSLGDNEYSGQRRVHRRLRILADVGSVLRIDVGKRMFAYLKPTSRIARDVAFIRDLMRDVIDAPGGYYKHFERAA